MTDSTIELNDPILRSDNLSPHSIHILRHHLAQLTPLIDAKRVNVNEFLNLVASQERIAGLPPTQIIRKNTLRQWLTYSRNNTLNPSEKYVVLHLPFIISACKSIANIQMVDITDRAREALYLIREEPFSNFVKIGKIMCGTMKKRMSVLRFGNPRTLVPLDSDVKIAMADRLLTETLSACRVSNEWYMCPDTTALNLLITSFVQITNETLQFE
jgi:hypothetical protein